MNFQKPNDIQRLVCVHPALQLIRKASEPSWLGDGASSQNTRNGGILTPRFAPYG
jgi:hypothetical protein